METPDDANRPLTSLSKDELDAYISQHLREETRSQYQIIADLIGAGMEQNAADLLVREIAQRILREQPADAPLEAPESQSATSAKSELAKLKATPERFWELAQANLLSQAGFKRAMQIADLIPTPTAWITFLNQIFLALGTSFLLAGIMFFFAFNWSDLSSTMKFGVIQAGIGIAITLVFLWRVDTLNGQAALIAASILVGVLFAVIGQVYQTGADSYQLFLVWGLLITGWAISSKLNLLWLVWLILLDLAMIFYVDQVQVITTVSPIFMMLMIFNSLVLIASELRLDDIRWVNRLMALIVIVIGTTYFTYFCILLANEGFSEDYLALLAVVVYPIMVGGLYHFYYRIKPDLLVITLAALSLIVSSIALMFSFLSLTGIAEAGEGMVVCLGILVGGVVLAEAVFAFQWLSRLDKEMIEREIHE